MYFDHEELEAQQRDAPRLPGQSIGSKVMVGSLLLCCCGVITICVLCIASLAVALPPPHRAGDVSQQQAAGAALVSIDQRGVNDVRPRHHAQRSVIRRLALLRRSTQGRGVDIDSVKLLFPAWLNSGGALVAELAVGDIVLALSYLSQEDEPDDMSSVGVG